MLSLSGCFRLLLALYARLLIMLSLADLLLDSGLGTASLEAAKCTVQSLVLF